MKRGFLDISFGVLFAIIVGVIILFFAIYTSSKIIRSGEHTINTETAKRLGVLTNPLETGFESAEKNKIVLDAETRIYNICDESGNFGEQKIAISQKSFGKWGDTGANIIFKNKYFFSEGIIEGKEFYLFSKPFKMPFKVADLIIIIPKNKEYCFIDAPREIAEELNALEIENIHTENCSGDEIKVCFSISSGCDIIVNLNANYVQKRGSVVNFIGDALMYGAIFSDKDVYECQIKRLMKRISELAKVYITKEGIISKRDCNSNLNKELTELSTKARELENSGELFFIDDLAKKIDSIERSASCRLW